MARTRLVRLDQLQQFTAINLLSDPGYDPSDRHIPNGVQITLYWTLASGKIGHNVLHASYQGTYAGSQAQANGILNGLGTGAQWTALAGFIAPTASLAFVSLRDLNAEDQPIISSNGAAHPGTSTGTELPNEVAAVVTLRTAFVGRAHRGRIFVPGWATNAIGAGNTITAAAVTALANWASIIAGVMQANGGYIFGLGHYSRQEYISPATGATIPARPPGMVPIVSTEVRDNHWDSARRRGLR